MKNSHNKFKAMNYLLRTLLNVIVAVSMFMVVQAQDSKNTVVISLKNGKYLSLQVCTDHIFRIRVASKADFPETLMERYGILKTDWALVKITSKNERETRIIQTGGFQLTVNEETVDLSVKDTNGKPVIEKVQIFYRGNRSEEHTS